MTYFKLTLFYFILSGFLAYALFARNLLFFTIFSLSLELIFFFFSIRTYEIVHRITYFIAMYTAYGVSLALFS